MIISLLFLSFNMSQSQINPELPPSINGWQIENDHGYVSESNGVFRLWSDGGRNWSVAFYKEIKPTDDFTFVYQVKAEEIDATGLLIKRCLPIAGQIDGFNFEYGHYRDELFLLARNFPFFPNWMFTPIAHGELHKWFTMKLTVSKLPFTISTYVYDENNTLVGSYSTSDITNFTFDDISYLGVIAWGANKADTYFRILQDPFGEPPNISISTKTSDISAGSSVDVFGTLTDKDGLPLVNRTVVLSYTFLGANSWIPISSDQTDEQGKYNIQWISAASGTFTLKTEWSGDLTHTVVSNTTNLSFLPYKDKQAFVFESNSTVTALAFDNQTSTLSFNVSGLPNTTGYIKVTIAKSLQGNGENLQAFIDGKQLNYSVSSIEDSWVYDFSYSHSTHQIILRVTNSATLQQPIGDQVILVLIIVIFGTILGVLVYSFSRSSKQENT